MYINQSAIKSFISCDNPSQWKNKWINKTIENKKTNSLSLGSLTDCLLFSPEEFDEKFVFYKEKYPTDKVLDICNSILDDGLVFDDSNIIFKAKEYSFGASTWKNDTIIKKIREEGEYYINYCINNKDKIPFTSQQYEIAECIVNNIINNPKTRKYFFEEEDNCEFIRQKTIESNIEGIPVKGTPDLFIIDHVKKKIILIDLKTSRNAYRFKQDIQKFGYALQMSFYKDLLESFYEGYTVDSCMNIVGDTVTCDVYIYIYNEFDLHIEKHGNKWSKGWLYYLKEINWHITNDIWNSTQEQENNGYINLCLH